MERKDLLILIVDAAGGGRFSPIQLQKSMFLASQAEYPELKEGSYEFEKHHYGPYSRKIHDDLAGLYTDGLVTLSPSQRGNWLESAITPKGHQRALELKPSLNATMTEYISDVVKWVRSQTFASLVRAIYNKYPEYKENSVFQG